jgi:hypothetical protein
MPISHCQVLSAVLIRSDTETMTGQWALATPSELGLSAEPLLNLHNDVLQGTLWLDRLATHHSRWPYRL